MRHVFGRALTGTVLRTIAAYAVVAALLPVEAVGTTSNYQVIVLHPSGLAHSEAHRIGDDQQVVGVGASQLSAQDPRALHWPGAGTQATSLNPGANFESVAWGVSGSRIVGWTTNTTTASFPQATLWTAFGSNRIALTPPRFVASEAFDVSGELIVGWGAGPATSTAQHALLWTGEMASSAVDLNPAGFVFSFALGVDAEGGQQVGYGNHFLGYNDGNFYDPNTRALLWYGTAASAVDLHPAGFDSSVAEQVDGGFQIGHGIPAGGTSSHALFWRSSAASAVDLNPAGFTESFGLGIRRGRQVGHGRGPATQDRRHALLWHVTAASAIDLHGFLPDQYVESLALDVDRYGNVVGAAVTAQGEAHAVLWQRLPELRQPFFPDGGVVQGNRYARIRVPLDGPAPAGDAHVALASSNPGIVAVPSSGETVVPSGQEFVIDGLWVNTVSAETRVTITASYAGVSRSVQMKVVPARLSALKFQPEDLPACQSGTGLAVLDGPAPAGGATVAISGGPPLATWPARVTVPAGADRTTFTITAGKTTGTVSLSASYAGDRVGNTLRIVAPTKPCPKGAR